MPAVICLPTPPGRIKGASAAMHQDAQEEANRIPEAALLRFAGLHTGGIAPPDRRSRREPDRIGDGLTVSLDEDGVSMDTPVRLLQGIVRAPLNDMAKPWVQTRDPSPNLPSERLPAGRIREMLRRFMAPKSFHA